MDRIIFDFENETFTVENDDGVLEHNIPGLKNSRERILADAGIMLMDASEVTELFKEFREGDIDQEEFVEKIMETFLDHVKSQYHDSLN
ncbi:MAG: hypothetical protein IKG55_07760 [Solobacterium sp.]|nr:hypothetical protein [Solobacterium sp.]